MLENVRLVIYALSSAIPASSLFHHVITCSRNNGNNDHKKMSTRNKQSQPDKNSESQRKRADFSYHWRLRNIGRLHWGKTKRVGV